MPVSGHQHEHNQSTEGEPTVRAGAGADDGRADDALLAGARAAAGGEQAAEPVVEIDERRGKMERLRSEGIEPYPHVSRPGSIAHSGQMSVGWPSSQADGLG